MGTATATFGLACSSHDNVRVAVGMRWGALSSCPITRQREEGWVVLAVSVGIPIIIIAILIVVVLLLLLMRRRR